MYIAFGEKSVKRGEADWVKLGQRRRVSRCGWKVVQRVGKNASRSKKMVEGMQLLPARVYHIAIEGAQAVAGGGLCAGRTIHVDSSADHGWDEVIGIADWRVLVVLACCCNGGCDSTLWFLLVRTENGSACTGGVRQTGKNIRDRAVVSHQALVLGRLFVRVCHRHKRPEREP